LLTLGGLVLVAVWALPIGLAHSPFVNWVAEQLTLHSGCTVRIGGLSLGWFSAVAAYDIDIDDTSGRPLLRAGSIESRRTLLGLLVNRADPGGFKVDRATIEIVLAGAGSNLDDAISQLIEPPAAAGAESGPRSLPPLNIEITDSSVSIAEALTGNTWRVQSVHASLRLFHEDELPVEGRIVGTLGVGPNRGTLEASLVVHAQAGVWKRGELKARLGGIPLDLAAPLVERVVARQTTQGVTSSESSTRLAGGLHGQFQVGWTLDGAAVTALTAQGEITAKSCEIMLAPLPEPLLLDQVSVPFHVRCDGPRVDVVNAEMICDLGHARYSGTIDLAAPGLSWLDEPGHELAATVELVRLAEKLPKTLSMHPDLRVTSGQLRLEAHNGAIDEPPAWTVRVNVTNITGVRGNQPIIWHEPVILDCRARQVGTGVPLVEEVHCTSGFLTLDGTTTAAGFHVHGDADLGKLADPLSRFIDLGPARLAGQVHGECTVRPEPGRRFRAEGKARVQDLFVEWLKGRPLEQELARLDFAAAGRIEQDGSQRLDTARVVVELGRDRVQADLAATLPALGGPDWGVWQVHLAGDLARWQKHARAGAPAVDRWQLGGAVVAQGQVRRGARGLECPELAVSVRNFRGAGAGVHINEPNLYMHGAAAFDDTGALHLRDMQFRCPTLVATATRLRWQPETGEASGAVSLRGDIGRLQHWWGDPTRVGPLAGEVDGDVQFHPRAQGMDYAFHGTMQGLLWNGESLSARSEPATKVHGRARLEAAEDRLLLGPVHIDGPLGAIVVQATITDLAGRCDLDLRGECDYDLPRLAAMLDPELDVRIAGKGTRLFALQGPLCPGHPGGGLQVRLPGGRPADLPLELRALRGDASLGLQSLHAPGVSIGPAEIGFCLQQGWLQMYPLETNFNGGRLRLQPHLRLDPGPTDIVLLPGAVVERAKITPEMCAGLLGHALPALGHVAQVEGTMSLILEGARIPLHDPSQAEVRGKIVLHGARFGPGPLSRELAGTFKTPPPACMVREREVPFHLQRGRVYHRDLELIFPEFTMRTSGSVGLDGSLALQIEMPIPVNLLGQTNVNSALAKQTIRLPIIGTVDQPHIDEHALHALSAQILRTIAAEALERKLKGLFRQ
jgi:hypothetical protein